ncbi:MAG: ABC transporter permease [Kiritimatiellae bacterium]|nr:ABC transporter permease [Kiritimatiellia bacterium]MDW8459156.1 ABC transporter permease [Verrucomicrobiota bacterium]
MWLRTFGESIVGRFNRWAHVVSIAVAAIAAALRPRYWPQPVRDVLARQILFTGFEAIRFVSMIAILVGLAVVLQAQLALSKLGQSGLLGPILVMVLIREAGPLLTNFVVIGRSGTAMTTELANMKVNGEVQLLDAQGLDPFIYLVMPRVLGAAISIFCLTIIFIAVSFASGFLAGLLLGANTGYPNLFIRSVFSAITPADVVNLILKSVVPGLLTGAICCSEGLSVGQAFTEVPQAATRAVVRSTATLFLTSAVVSLATYL